MRRGNKWLWAAITAFLLVGVLAVAVWAWAVSRTGPPQIVTLGNGEKFRFAGVTYGTNHIPPSILAHLIHALPRPAADLAQKWASQSVSQYNEGAVFDSPQLFVWFERMGKDPPLPAQVAFTPSYGTLADETGLQAGIPSGYLGNPAKWTYLAFPVIPRRSRTIQCVIDLTGSGKFTNVTFANPLYGRYPEWQPEPVPQRKLAGDLEVRLDGVRPAPFVMAGFVQWPDPPKIQIQYSLHAGKKPNWPWVLERAELSDATGNLLTAGPGFRSAAQGSLTFTAQMEEWHDEEQNITGTLWPTESAWKVKLSFRLRESIDTRDIVTLTNVPLTSAGFSTNFAAITNFPNGQVLVVKPWSVPGLSNMVARAIRSSGSQLYWPPPNSLAISAPGKPDDTTLDAVSIATHAGQAPVAWRSQKFDSATLELDAAPTDATVDITVSLQKLRTVEFLVKPPNPVGPQSAPIEF